MKRRLISIKRKWVIFIQGRRSNPRLEENTDVEPARGIDGGTYSNTESTMEQHSRALKTSQSQSTLGPSNDTVPDSKKPFSINKKDGSVKQYTKIISVPGMSTKLTNSTKREEAKSSGGYVYAKGLADEKSKSLVDRLSQALQRSAFEENRSFIPVGKLEILICRSAIRKELSSTQNGPTWMRPVDMKRRYTLAAKICPWHVSTFTPKLKIPKEPKKQRSSFKKIFAILVLMRRASEIDHFVAHAVTDDMLPLVRNIQEDKEFLASHSEPESVLTCFEHWERDDRHHFEDYQWRVLAPIFNQLEDGEDHHLNLQVDCVLPFCQWKCYARGGSACIYMAKIHPHHNKLEGTSSRKDVFAVKQLLKPRHVYPSYKNSPDEIDILRGMLKREHQHPHLINILATFCHDGMDYIILPWAEYDLLKYWRDKNRSPQPGLRTIKWMMEQCHGLASALYSIHRWQTFNNSRLYDFKASRKADSDDNEPLVLLGRHGDIKPMNILWLDNGSSGILKLADFGAAHFDAEGDPTPVNLDAQETPGYRAPESDSATTTNPSWDVWALGCVYLEFVTWLYQGWEGVDSFAKSRLAPDPRHAPFATTTFFEPREDGDNQTLKQVVRQHVEKLSKETRCVEVQWFLTYIIEKMVIVPNGNFQRSNATQVMQQTERLIKDLKKTTIGEASLLNIGGLIHL